MSFAAHQSQQVSAVPVIFHLQRLLLALCIVLEPGFGLAAVIIRPGYSNTQGGPDAALAATMAASTLQLQISRIAGTIGTYLFPGTARAGALALVGPASRWQGHGRKRRISFPMLWR